MGEPPSIGGVTDSRTARAEQMANAAWDLAGESLRMRHRPRGPSFWRTFRRPVGRRFAAVASRELVEAAGYDRGALLRGAELMDRHGDVAQAQIARWLLLEAVALVTTR